MATAEDNKTLSTETANVLLTQIKDAAARTELASALKDYAKTASG